jgi:sugar lactone lactonase YvrE
MLRFCINSLVFLLVAKHALPAFGQRMYFTDTVNDAIWSANVDASEITLLVEADLDQPRGIAIDPNSSTMYWVDYGSNRIERANLDGSGREGIAARGIDGPRGIAIDLEEGKLYWTNRDARTIQSANLDGTDTERLVTRGLSYPYTIKLDLANRSMYWEDRETRLIQRAGLDASNVTTVLTLDAAPGFLPVGFDIDWQESHIYFADGGPTHSIHRSNLDGSNEKVFIPTVSNVRAVTLETQNRRLYWVEDDGRQDVIRRATLDGRLIEDVLWAPYFSVRAIAFDYRPSVFGDFNHDLVLDVMDIQSLVDEFGDPINVDVYDLDHSQEIDVDDLVFWLKQIRKTWVGDANLDGEFNTRDLVDVFQAGQYEDGVTGKSNWGSGDWNGDGDFDTSDLVTAFQDGGYEQGPLAGVKGVPEPSGGMPLAFVALIRWRIRKRLEVNS